MHMTGPDAVTAGYYVGHVVREACELPLTRPHLIPGIGQMSQHDISGTRPELV